MGWIETIRSLLGLQSNGHRETGDVEVTVEKEPDASSERAVKEPTEADVVERDDTVEGDDEEPEPEAAEESDSEPAVEPEAEPVEESEVETEEEAEADPVEESEVETEEEAEADLVEESEAEADDEAEGELVEETETDEEAEAEADDEAVGELVEETEAEATEEIEVEADAEKSPSEPAETLELTEIKGIGSAYADRLHAAGVEDGADLAAADAADLSAETDISAKRLQRWIDQITER